MKIKSLLLLAVFLIFLTVFTTYSFALGKGDYGVAAYRGNRFVEEVRLLVKKTGDRPYWYKCRGRFLYYGNYTKRKVGEWKSKGYSVFIVRNIGSKYVFLCKVN